MPLEQAREYLARVLPWPQEGDEPAYANLHWTFVPKDMQAGRKLPWSGRACRSLDEAANALDYALKQPNTRDIFLCQSTQRVAEEKVTSTGWKYYKPIRSTENAVALKSLYLDVDAKGTDNNSYANINEAVAAYVDFQKAVGLPRPSVIVQSGGGLHIYFTLDRALTVEKWRPLAYALAEATKRHGLKCDTQVTVDAARVLRIPQTFNRKLETARPVRIAGQPNDFDYSVERIEEILAPYKVAIPVGKAPQCDLSLFPTRAPVTGYNDISAGIEREEFPPINLKSVLPECGFLRDAFTYGGKDYPNPLWNLTTLIATFCEDGERLAHLMGRKHPGYPKEATDEQFERKTREREEKGLGWPSCRTISGHGATQCAGCKHFADGKSPLHLQSKHALLGNAGGGGSGNRLANATGNAPGAPANTASGTTVPVTQTDLPGGYTRGADGVVLHISTGDDGANKLTPISDYPMTSPWLQKDPWVLHFTTVTERGKIQQVSLPIEVNGKTEMRGVLQEQGMMVPVGNKGQENIARFFMSWIKKLQETKESVSSSPFGWHVKRGVGAGAGGLEGFIFGGAIWTPTGSKAAANPDTVIARHYTPTGQLAPWVDAAQLVTSQGRPDIAVLLASAFAAPLVRFTGHPGVLLSAYSQESGIGKSTALKVAQAVWGNPVVAVQSLSDTQNSVMHKLGEIKNLPLYWDELKTDEDTKKFVNITFQTTQGKEKSRMTSRITQREPGQWQTLLVSASNDSLLDYVVQNTNTTTAGLYRIFQYVVKPALPGAVGQIDTSDASLIIANLNDNYGHVGLEYAKFLGAHHATIAQQVSDFSKALGREVAAANDERFWMACITCVCMGARYANHLGFTKFDEPALKEFLLTVLQGMRGERSSQPVDMANALNVSARLAQFLSAMRAQHTLRTNRIHVSKGKPPTGAIKVVSDVSRLGAVHVHIGMEDKLLRIGSQGLGEWLHEKNYSRHLFTDALVKEFKAQKVVGRLGSGTQFANATEYLFQIDLAGSPHVNFIDET